MTLQLLYAFLSSTVYLKLYQRNHTGMLPFTACFFHSIIFTWEIRPSCFLVALGLLSPSLTGIPMHDFSKVILTWLYRSTLCEHWDAFSCIFFFFLLTMPLAFSYEQRCRELSWASFTGLMFKSLLGVHARTASLAHSYTYLQLFCVVANCFLQQL